MLFKKLILSIVFMVLVIFSVSAQENLTIKNDSISIEKCQNDLNEKKYIIFILNEELKKSKAEILRLDTVISKLKTKITIHNNKLKKSQLKFRID